MKPHEKEHMERLKQGITLLTQQKRYEEAVHLANQVSDWYRQHGKEHDVEFADLLDILIHLYEEMNDYGQAETLCQKALSLRLQLQGELHPDVVATLIKLAVLNQAMKDSSRAIFFCKQALKIQQTLLGEKHLVTARILSLLATLHSKMHHYQQAVHFYQQVLEIQRELLGEPHWEVALTALNLANVFSIIGAHQQAEALYHQALDSWFEQADLLHQSGQDQAAIEKIVEACALALECFGEKHPLFFRTHQKRLDFEQSIMSKELPELVPTSETSLDKAAFLAHEGIQTYQKGDFEQSEALFLRALELLRPLPDETEQTKLIMSSLRCLGAIYIERKDNEQAISVWEQLLEAQQRNPELEEMPDDMMVTLGFLWDLHYKQGNYLRAQQLAQHMVVLVKESGTEATSYALDMAGLFRRSSKEENNLERAMQLGHQALTLQRLVLEENDLEIAETLNVLASLYYKQGNYQQAEILMQQALEILRQAPNEPSHRVATYMNNLATTYSDQGKFEQARELYYLALKMLEAAPEEVQITRTQSLVNLGWLCYMQGDYTEAKSLYLQALELLHSLVEETDPAVARVLNMLGILYYEQGDYQQAEPMLQRALAIRWDTLGEEHPDVAQTLGNLGILYVSTGKFEQAAVFLQRALQIQKKVLGEAHPHTLGTLHNLAWLYRTWRGYEQAEDIHRQVLEKRREVFGLHPKVAETLNDLGAVALCQGNYAQAEQFLDEALGIQRAMLGETHPDLALTLANLAGFYAATHRPQCALTTMKQAIAIEDQALGQIFSMSSERQRMAYVEKLQISPDTFLSLIAQHFSNTPEAVQSGLEMVLRRKAIGMEALITQREAVLSGRYPMLVSSLEELTRLRQKIAEMTLARPGSEGLEAYQKHLRELQALRESLEADLAHRVPEMNLTMNLQRVSLQAIAEALADGTALVEFVHYHVIDFCAVPARGERPWKPAHYMAFVLPASQPEQAQMIDLGEAEIIDRQIDSFRSSLIGDTTIKAERHLQPGKAYQQDALSTLAGIELRRLVFDPLQPYIGAAKQLFLAPDGSLNRLPFEVLPVDGTMRLIDQYQVSYVSAGRDVLQFGARTQNLTPAEPSLVVASPDFNLTAEGDDSSSANNAGPFPRLKGAETEGKQIADLLQVKPLIGKEALESVIKECHSPRIFHLATHGFFLPDQQDTLHEPSSEGGATIVILMDGQREINRSTGLTALSSQNPMLRSGLALAGANTWSRGGKLPPEAQDGILTAEDVVGLDLLNTELVVLSACETGLGEVQVGEGVFGLRRAFALAGARRLVMSLWKVPDAQTQELMVDFYRRILYDHQSPANALREAQLAMKAKYPHPFFWGAFICQGDPGKLS